MFINCSRSSTREISNLQKSSTAIPSENQDGVRNFNSINEGNVSVFFFLKKQRAVVSFFHICLFFFYLFILGFNVCIVYNVITAQLFISEGNAPNILEQQIFVWRIFKKYHGITAIMHAVLGTYDQLHQNRRYPN